MVTARLEEERERARALKRDRQGKSKGSVMTFLLQKTLVMYGSFSFCVQVPVR